MRQQQKRDEGGKKHFSHTSPRTLLGVLRLSQALARLRFSQQVVTEDVDEALRLIDVSKSSLYNDQRAKGDQTPSTQIYNLIRGMMESGAAAVGDGSRGELNMRRVSELVIAKGFTRDQLTHCIDEYALLDVSLIVSILYLRLITDANRAIQVWQVANNGTRLVFIDAGDDEDYMDVGSEDDVE
jgi:DNA replication licensing factor MCM7